MNRTLLPSIHTHAFALVSLFLLALASQALAQNSTWTWPNYNSGNNWSSAGSWAGGIPTASNTAIFNNPGDQFVTVSTGNVTGGLTFSTNGTFGNDYYFNAGSLILSNGAVVQTDSSYLGIAGFNTAPVLAGNVTFAANGAAGSGLVFGNTVSTTTGAGAVSLTLEGSNTGYHTFANNILAGAVGQGIVFTGNTTIGSTTMNVSTTTGLVVGQQIFGNPAIPSGATISAIGTGNITLSAAATATVNGGATSAANAGTSLKLIKNGTGTWVILGGNSFTGGVDLNGGTLITGSSTALGSSGAINVLSNTTLRTATALNDPSSRTTISDGATLTFDTFNQNITWQGVLGNSGGSNTAGLTKAGLGVLTWRSANITQTYRGATTINAGQLVIDGLTAGNTTTATVVNPISSNSTLVLGGGILTMRAGTASTANSTTTVAGSNVLRLTGNNTTALVGSLVTGANITANTTIVSISGANITLSNNLTGGASGSYNFGATSLTQTFNGTTLNPGVSEFRSTASSGTNIINFGNITRSSGGVLNIVTAGGFTFQTSSPNDTAGAIKGILWDQARDFARVSGGNLTAATYTTQNDASLWNSGAIIYTTNGTVTSAVGTGGTTDIGGLKLNFAGANSFSINGTLRTANGIIFGSSIGNAASEISGGNLTSVSGDLIIANANNQNNYTRNTVSSTIVDNGSATDVVFLGGAGTLYISGNNTYTGNTYVAGGQNSGSGTVLVGGAAGASIGSAGKTVFVNGGTGGASSILRVGNGDATGDVKGTIDLVNGRLSLNRNDAFTLSASVIGTTGAGSISLDNVGNATLNLGAGNNFFASLGSTANGTLNLAGSGTYTFNSAPSGFAAGSTTNFNSGTYYFGAPGNAANTIGTWVVNGANVIIAGGRYFNNQGGNLTLNSGTLKVNGPALTGANGGTTSNLTIYNVTGGTFTTAMTSNTGVAASLSIGSGNVTSAGANIFNQSGGVVNISVPNNANTISNNGQGLAIGVGGSNHESSYNLSGGTLRNFGGIYVFAPVAAPGVGGSNNFNWTGGTLTTASYNGSFLLSNSVNNTLVQNGATTVMAPGDFYEGVRYSGRTAISGNYTILSGTVSLGLSGNVAAATFHETGINRFDNITVTGAANLGGNLAVTLYLGSTGSTFVPVASDVFTVMTYGSRTGTFANSGNKVVLVNDPFDGTLNINYNAANLTLSGYVINQWGGTSSVWGTSGGSAWTSGVEPNAAGKGAVFGSAGTANTTVTLDADRTVGQIVFDTANYTIGGSANLTFDNSGSAALITYQDSGSRSITAPIVLASDLIVVGNSTGSLTLGALSGSGRSLTMNGSGMSVTLSGNNSYGATVVNTGVSLNVGNGGTAGSLGTGSVANNGTITFIRTDSALNVSSSISGSGNVTQAGSGVTTLSAANSYTGTTRVDAGTLRLAGSGTLGATTSVLGQISSGAILDLNGTNQTVASFSGNSTGGFIQNNSGTGTSVLTVGGASNTTFQGQIRDNDGIATGGRVGVFIGGTSNLSLTANNTYSGGTIVGTGATLTINAVSTQSGGVILGGSTGVGNVTLEGGSTVRNSVNSNVWFMDTLRVEGNVTLAGTQRLNMTYRTMDLTGGNRTFNVTGRSTGVTGGNTIGSDATGNSQWEMANTTLLGVPVVRDGVMNLQTTYTGPNYGSMRFSNTTTFNNASVVVGSNVLLYLGGSLGTNATNSAAVTIASGGIVNLTAGNRTMGSLAGSGNLFGSMVVANTNNVTLTLNSASGSTDFGGVLSNGPGNGTLSLAKTGASTQILSNANTFNGTTSVSGGGVLRVSAVDALGSTRGVTVTSNATLDITVSNAVNDAATVSLGGGTIAKGAGLINETFGALTLTANSTINFGSGTGSFTFASYTPGSFVLKFENFDIGNSLTVTTGTFNAGAFDFNGFGYSWAEAPVGGFTITAIPEPSAVAAALAFLGLAAFRCRRKKAANARVGTEGTENLHG